MDYDADVVVIGAGLAGLTCAKHICEAGLSCRLLEASDGVGGRVRTDQVDGFLLDRGFQVFLTAYPAAKAELDYSSLDLRTFEPGALVMFEGQLRRLSDPWRRPQHLLSTALSPVATLRDKMKIASFRRHTTEGTLRSLYERPETPTIDRLRERGFSNVIIDRFFKPFLGGIFLESELQTSSRMGEFVFRMFSIGDAALPAGGMGAIPKQLAGRLPENTLRLNSPVEAVEGQTVRLESGKQITAKSVVVATEAPAARRLLGDGMPAPGKSVFNFYFAAEESPIDEPTLVLNGTGGGPINNLCVPSLVSAEYAPAGKALVSVTVLDNGGQNLQDPDAILPSVVSQLSDWFGSAAQEWQFLRSYAIPFALPEQQPPALEPVMKPVDAQDQVWVCGDHCDTASINGAMASGRRAAEAVIAAASSSV